MSNKRITNSYVGPELLLFRVVSGVLKGPDASLATIAINGTGDWTITLGETALQTVNCFPPISETADVQVFINTTSTTAINVKSRSITTSPAAADADFSLIVLVNRAPSKYRAPGSAL